MLSNHKRIQIEIEIENYKDAQRVGGMDGGRKSRPAKMQQATGHTTPFTRSYVRLLDRGTWVNDNDNIRHTIDLIECIGIFLLLEL